MMPIRLPVNTFPHFYAGGGRLRDLRGRAVDGPEEWLASTVTRWGAAPLGTTMLDGTPLADLVAADPVTWLGAEHVARWGPSPALLVKLLDAGERLPVHVHPTRRFAAAHLDCPFGKTEAWVVIDVPAGGGDVFVGANRPVPAAEWGELVAAQRTDDMLNLLNQLRVRPGDAVLVPAGTPHAIGAGVFVVEMQEPTDFSILLEWDGFAVDGADGMLGLPRDVALGAVRHDAVDARSLDALVRRADTAASASSADVLPEAAAPYFRAAWLRGDGPSVTLDAAFSVVVVLDGDGRLRTAAGTTPVARGDVLVVPHAAGPITVEATASVVVARPPDPAAPEPTEWDAR